MKRKRLRNKRKFGGARSGGKAATKNATMTVKIKPKEEEPCRTLNPQPKVRTPIL